MLTKTSIWDVRIHTTAELLRFPEPKWLIDSFLHEQETACLWGPPNCGKSFIALDWALSVASGTPWLGHFDTIQSPVLYMAGEGAFSLQKRVRAWQQAHEGVDVDSAYFHVRPLPLLEDEVIDALGEALESFVLDIGVSLNPGLIIIDTLSQFFGGGDEVGPEMAKFVNNVRRLSHEQNLSVLIVHHSNATGQRERGHTALRGNVDAMYEARPKNIQRIEDGVMILTDKQRDAAKGDGLAVGFEEWQFGRDRSSLVPMYDEHANVTTLPMVHSSLMRILAHIDASESPETESISNVGLMEELGLPKKTFYRRMEALTAKKLIKTAGRGKSALTYLGRAVLAKEER